MQEEDESEIIFTTSDNLLSIEADDPLEAIIKIDEEVRPSREFRIQHVDHVGIVNRYFEMIKHACNLFGVAFELTDGQANGISEAEALFYAVKTEIDKRKLDLLHAKLQMNSAVILDESWREKIHSYLAHVRRIVETANISVEIRDSIMSKLHDLDEEVDRKRTRIQKATDVLVDLCKGLSQGAKELGPAVRLFERIVGAMAQVRPSPQQTPALPAPESLGLEAPDTIDVTENC